MKTTVDHFGPLCFDENNFGQLWATLNIFLMKTKIYGLCFAPNQLFSDEQIRNHFVPLWTTLDQFTNSNQKSEIFINDNDTTGQF